jgi:hypothetical protein
MKEFGLSVATNFDDGLLDVFSGYPASFRRIAQRQSRLWPARGSPKSAQDRTATHCSYDKLKDPAQYLRSEFIRPEDPGLYRDLGYDSFKVLERGAPTPVLAKRVKAYSEGRYEGNLLDLIQRFGYKEKSEVSLLGGLAGKLKYFFRPRTVRLHGHEFR